MHRVPGGGSLRWHHPGLPRGRDGRAPGAAASRSGRAPRGDGAAPPRPPPAALCSLPSPPQPLPDPLGHQGVQVFPCGQLAQEFPVGFAEDPIGVPAGGHGPSAPIPEARPAALGRRRPSSPHPPCPAPRSTAAPLLPAPPHPAGGAHPGSGSSTPPRLRAGQVGRHYDYFRASRGPLGVFPFPPPPPRPYPPPLCHLFPGG